MESRFLRNAPRPILSDASRAAQRPFHPSLHAHTHTHTHLEQHGRHLPAPEAPPVGGGEGEGEHETGKRGRVLKSVSVLRSRCFHSGGPSSPLPRLAPASECLLSSVPTAHLTSHSLQDGPEDQGQAPPRQVLPPRQGAGVSAKRRETPACMRSVRGPSSCFARRGTGQPRVARPLDHQSELCHATQPSSARAGGWEARARMRTASLSIRAAGG